jgi:hypothetical protein
MGQGRGGLYTYEWIENVLGAQIHNLDRLDPVLQKLRVGDHIRLTPELYLAAACRASTTASGRAGRRRRSSCSNSSRRVL